MTHEGPRYARLMQTLVLLLVLAALVAVTLVVFWRLRRSRAGVRPSPDDPLRQDAAAGMDPRRIGVGDVVHYDGRDFIVRGTLEFEESGFRWQEHLLDDVEVRRWLSVEEDEELVICLWERVTVPELTPGAARLDYQTDTYILQERGRAIYKAHGTTGTGPSGEVDYIDYAAGDKRLAFERFGHGGWEVSVGRVDRKSVV